MYDTILVPLDGSERAEAILPHVEEMAQRYGSTVVFLQVVEPVPMIMGPEGSHMVLQQQEIEKQTQEAERYVAAREGEFEGRGITARSHVAYGPVVQAIIDSAERESADLIALASHGRTGLSQVFYGSVAAGVLHRIDRPLLLVRSSG